LLIADTGTSATVINTSAHNGFAGISIYGNLVSVSGSYVASIVGSDAVGIAVNAARGVRITQTTVSDCTADLSVLGGGGRAVGIFVDGAWDVEVVDNIVVNLTGGDGTAVDSSDEGGGAAVGILIQNVQNATVYGNIINSIQGGGVIFSGTPLIGGVGGSAFGIQINLSSSDTTSNTVIFFLSFFLFLVLIVS
jgi:hypothetical protein